ncbi:4-hydroxybenzoate 3-monooxygenase [Puniceibacterium antarcticum]|uniref:4-hydroxybenzoate 3-monooxygenase n=1 Tax=Puniceibacterium antarcticum TaxID=1206336 RepID=A0A2G8R6N9_9RHOB|nr:4-hydroxybenzoate 3-monooxygenase [Puniceibacterium antarcticum]PIL17225.1 4-hydroxybenzoate 3-monooxygenase [Puniceibacterium antarcticum]
MTRTVKTQVCIIGAGPSGLLLSQLLANVGIDTVVLDRKDRAYIEGRIRAGVLEQGTVTALEEAGVADRLHREGLPHEGFEISFDGDRHRIDIKALTDKTVTVYGQTEVTKDLFDKRFAEGQQFFFNVENVTPIDLKSATPRVAFTHDGEHVVIACDYISGCDGFHGVSRQAIPADVLKTFERVYPFGWLGAMVDKPPVSHELIYANHERGFALASMRSETRSRYYVQCDVNDDIGAWSDDRFWEELALRLGPDAASNLTTGPSFEKSIAPLRSFVAEPMRYGNLFLAGDAAHIVPPTGAKGLNLAMADIRILSRALIEHYKDRNDHFIETYSQTVLTRVWKVERFSWQLSTLMHQFPQNSPFEKRMQRAEFDFLSSSESASRAIAENYVGLPLD